MLKVLRERSYNLNGLPRGRLGETHTLGMQKKPARRAANAGHGGCAIKTVSGDRVAQGSQMDTDLMGTPRGDMNFEQRVFVEPLQHGVFRPRATAALQTGGHPHAADRVAGNRFFDSSVVLFDFAVHQRHIGFFDRAARELFRKALVRTVGLRHYQHAAGESVQPVDNARPQIASHTRESLEVVEQGIDQRSGVHSGARVDNHSSRLVDGNHIGIFVEDV